MEYKIENILIYLRKSRGDDDDVLEKHRIRLTEYAESKGWKYVIKEEDIVSGERLSTRPVMLEILDILEEKDCIYDGVLVAHYDRLSRGNQKDFGTIIEVFQFANKYIITPDRVYDTNNTHDLAMLGIQGVFAHNELRTIVTRFVDGKKDGARLGNWTNGKPPYPYYYSKKITVNEKGKEIITGEVLIDEKKLIVYNRIKDLYINQRIGTEEIGFIFNRENIPSPGGKKWSSQAVLRLLVDEFHLGIVAYGKKEWKKNRDNKRVMTRERDESEYIKAKGNHTPVKTQEEHDEIIKLLKRNQKIPRKSRAGIFPTSGILYCKKCDHRMIYSVMTKEKKTGKTYNYTKCWYKTPTGDKCPQVGIKMDEDFYNALYNIIISQYLDEAYMNSLKSNSNDLKILNKSIDVKTKELKKKQSALEKIQEAYEEGEYTLQEYSSRKTKRANEINIIEQEIKTLKEQLKNQQPKVNEQDLIKKINNFKQLWHNTESPKKLNSILKNTVKKIYYDRKDKEVTFEVEYF